MIQKKQLSYWKLQPNNCPFRLSRNRSFAHFSASFECLLVYDAYNDAYMFNSKAMKERRSFLCSPVKSLLVHRMVENNKSQIAVPSETVIAQTWFNISFLTASSLQTLYLVLPTKSFPPLTSNIYRQHNCLRRTRMLRTEEVLRNKYALFAFAIHLTG